VADFLVGVPHLVPPTDTEVGVGKPVPASVRVVPAKA
jgi:hypothetical protein